jgi:hypothetical protein
VHQQGLVYQNITSVINIKTVGTIVMSLKVVITIKEHVIFGQNFNVKTVPKLVLVSMAYVME